MRMMDVDWHDRQSVVRFAQFMADKSHTDMVVIRHRGLTNFNITHLSRPDRWTRPTVVYRRVVKARRSK